MVARCLLTQTRSGQLKWYAQPISRDLRDYDFEASPILTAVRVNGTSRDTVIGAGKAGYVVGFDRRTGDQLWKTAVGRHQNDELPSYPADNPLEVYPGATGGVETPMALADGTVYIPVVNLATDFTASTFSVRNPASGTGEFDAIDAATGTVLWKADLDAPDFGGATVAGDLVFTSTFAGDVHAFERASGRQVWSWQAPGEINGFISVAGDVLLVPVGLGKAPQLVALKSVRPEPLPNRPPRRRQPRRR
jgi:glucose dehydrogenase